jgi:hypothetical protein
LLLIDHPSRALETDFNQFGSQAIALVREKKPEVYMRAVADLLPKEANINVEAGEAFVRLFGFIGVLPCRSKTDLGSRAR